MRSVISVFLVLVTCVEAHRRLIGGNAACGRARIRKSWDAMTTAERRAYNNAVEASIEQGIFHHFVKVHMDRRSEMEAHDTCGFVLWHRRYVLAYENMLRTMPNAACVTVPYWDIMTHLKNMVDGNCHNAQDCCAITTGIGGLPRTRGTRTFNGRRVTNHCYSGAPYQAYCDDNDDCGCMPRNDMSAMTIPVGAGFVSLFNMISTSRSYAEFTDRLESGIHRDIHNLVGGIMATYAAPSDAIFFSWHATVDMLMYIWHECHVAEPMSNVEKRRSAYAFNQEEECRLTRDALNNINSMDSTRTMMMRVNGRDIRQHEEIGQYFRDVGTAYWAFADARSMGDYSYTYEIPSDFTQYLLGDEQMCPTAQVPSPTPSDTSTGQPSPSPNPSPSPTPTPTPTPGDDDGDDGELTYWEWYELTKANLETRIDDPDEVLRQLEYLECIGFDEKFGVHNFTDDFIEEFLQGKEVEPRCLQILEQIENDETSVDSEGQETLWGGNADPSANATHPPAIDLEEKLANKTKGRTDDPDNGAPAHTIPTLVLTLFLSFLCFMIHE